MGYLSEEDIKRIRSKYPETKKKPPQPPTIERKGAVYASATNAKGVKSIYASLGRTKRIAYSAEDQPHYVYFIQSDENQYIKIGHTADLNKRKSQLQTGSAGKLSYIGTILFPSEERAIQVEESIHKSFSTIRLHGEWFAPDEALLTFIKTHHRDDEDLTNALSALESTQNNK